MQLILPVIAERCGIDRVIIVSRWQRPKPRPNIVIRAIWPATIERRFGKWIDDPTIRIGSVIDRSAAGTIREQQYPSRPENFGACTRATAVHADIGTRINLKRLPPA